MLCGVHMTWNGIDVGHLAPIAVVVATAADAGKQQLVVCGTHLAPSATNSTTYYTHRPLMVLIETASLTRALLLLFDT